MLEMTGKESRDLRRKILGNLPYADSAKQKLLQFIIEDLLTDTQVKAVDEQQRRDGELRRQ